MVKVSICVPVYNVEKYIERCARSLFEQTFESLEYIFVDDCSKDHSLEILEKVIKLYPNRAPFVKVIKHQRNSGPGVARETAGKNAVGDYIYFPDSDDWVEPTMMEELYNKAIAEEADIVLCQWDIVDKEVKADSFNYKDYTKDQWLKMLIKREAPLSLPRRLFSRNLYNEGIKNVNNEGLVRFEDFILVFFIHYNSKKVSFVDKVFYHVQRHEDSLTKSFTVSAIESNINVCNQLKNYLISQEAYDNYVEEIEKWLYNSYVYYILFDTNTWNPQMFRDAFLSNKISPKYGKTKNAYLNKLIGIQTWLVMKRFFHAAYVLCLLSSVYLRLKK